MNTTTNVKVLREHQVTENVTERLVEKKAFQVIGLANYKSEMLMQPKIPATWDEYFSTEVPKRIDEVRAESGMLGAFFNADDLPGYWVYLIGAVTKEDCGVAPRGMKLMTAPAGVYAELIGPPVKEYAESIQALVGYVHGDWKPPEGYERDMQSQVMFIEVYPDAENGEIREEVWVPLRKAA